MPEQNYYQPKQFRRSLDQAMDAIAQRHGFVRLTACVHDLPRDGIILGGVGFPYGVSSISTLGRTSLSPVIGVRHVDITRITRMLLGLGETRTPGIHVRQSLEQLPPGRWRGYEVFLGRDNRDVLDRIEHDLVTYGLPWIEAHASLESIIQETAPKRPSPEGYWFDHLVALGIAGRLDELKKKAEYQDEYCRSDAAVIGYKQYRKFLKDVLEHFGLSLDHPV